MCVFEATLRSTVTSFQTKVSGKMDRAPYATRTHYVHSWTRQGPANHFLAPTIQYFVNHSQHVFVTLADANKYLGRGDQQCESSITLDGHTSVEASSSAQSLVCQKLLLFAITSTRSKISPS